MAAPTASPGSEFDVGVVDGLAVVTTPDEIDVANAAQFRAALLAAARRGGPVLVVDMGGTEFCDSTGLNVLVRALRQEDQIGTTMRLVVRTSALKRILSVSGVGSMFGCYDSLDQAVHAAEPRQVG
jgi:anti-sigma B factor antagonist